MLYEEIHGWFDWPEFYKDFAQRCPIGGSMVELGVWMGKSLCFLAEYCEQVHRRDIALFGVDTFGGCEELHDKFLASLEGDRDELKRIATENLAPFKNVQLMPIESAVAARSFADHSLDLVFIDANHNYSAVKQNIIEWLPKVKAGGILAGHDIITWPGVKKAVTEMLPGYQRQGDIWIKRL